MVRERSFSAEPAIRQQRYVAPTLIDEPDDDSPVMRQEIFGPLLPVKGFHDIETVIRYVNERDKPLALYYFGGRREADRVLRSTSSAGPASTIRSCNWPTAGCRSAVSGAAA